MDDTKYVDLTVLILPAAKKAYEMMKLSPNIFIMKELRQRIVDQLEKGEGSLNLDEATKVLTELNHDIYAPIGHPNLVAPYRVKDGLLWFRAKKHWFTVSEHKEMLSEPINQ